MKLKSTVILIFCVSLAATVLAQSPSKSGDDKIVGNGTAGFLARFTAAQSIGNSKVYQAPDGSIGIGTTTPVWPLHIFSDRKIGSGGYPPIAVWAESTASNTWGGVYSVASSLTGNTIALNGEAYSPNGTGVIGQGGQNGVIGATFGPGGNGVFGVFQPLNSNGGGGVIGITNATSGFSYGARGDALGTTGGAVAIFAQTYSPDGVAGYFLNRAGGNIIVGHVGQNDDVSVFRVDGNGTVFADGGFQSSGADFAESMAVAGDRTKYVAGDLLAIDPTANRRLALARQPYSALVAGIYSTKPGMLATNRKLNEIVANDEVPLGVVGIVPCKVTAENGPIHVGDLLVTSSTPGHAMKGTDRKRMLGAVVGKALEPLLQGTGVIQVLVTLQ
jgi:hypothetical protein